MSVVTSYLTQRATWKRTVGLNEYGEPVTADTTIRVRWEGKRRLVRNAQGQEVVSEARVFCVDPVQPGDILEHDGRGWPVITVSAVPGLGGATSHREVAV